jgi:proline iminopeptidase
MTDGQLINEAHRIAHLPIIIVQGRYDVVCPAATSWALYKALGGTRNKNVEYRIIGDCGHSAHEDGIGKALVDAVEKFKALKA